MYVLLPVSTPVLLMQPRRPKVAQRRHLLQLLHGHLDFFLPVEEMLGIADQVENFRLLFIFARLSQLQEPPPSVPTFFTVACNAIGAQRRGKGTRRRLHVQPQLLCRHKSLARKSLETEELSALSQMLRNNGVLCRRRRRPYHCRSYSGLVGLANLAPNVECLSAVLGLWVAETVSGSEHP